MRQNQPTLTLGGVSPQIESFTQDQRHLTKSERFKPIQPSLIRDVLDGHGFDLVHLKTGRAKSIDRVAFQTTVARYRSRDQFDIQGLGFDLIFKVPHLYGALVGVLGLFRGVCANQLNVGQWFDSAKVRHTGDPISELNSLIPRLVAQRAALVDQVRAMSARPVTPQELADLAQTVAVARLADTQNVTRVYAADLLKPRRQEDLGQDLFTCLNVIQENLMSRGFRYQTETVDAFGATLVRNGTARRVSAESVKAIDLNASIWDAATQLLKAA